MPPFTFWIRNADRRSTDTPYDFHVPLPAHLPIEKPFFLQVRGLYVTYGSGATGSARCIQVYCSLGNKYAYDTSTFGTSDCIAIFDNDTTVSNTDTGNPGLMSLATPRIYCLGSGGLNEIRVRLLDYNGAVLAPTGEDDVATTDGVVVLCLSIEPASD